MSSHQLEKPNNKVLYFIREYWVIITFIIGLTTTWANFKSNDARADERITKLETASLQENSINSDILVKLGELGKDIEWIKLNLKK